MSNRHSRYSRFHNIVSRYKIHPLWIVAGGERVRQRNSVTHARSLIGKTNTIAKHVGAGCFGNSQNAVFGSERSWSLILMEIGKRAYDIQEGTVRLQELYDYPVDGLRDVRSAIPYEMG